MKLVGLALLLLEIGASSPAWGRTLVVSFSDSHSHYGNLVRFVIGAARMREKFLRESPDGTVVLLVPGDMAGLSAWSRDQGNLVYEMLEAMAHRFQLVVGIGNHDGFDFRGHHGNELFLEQSLRLAERVEAIQGKPFHLIGANLALTELGRRIIAPYRDIATNGGKIRFSGLVLDEFFTKSDYSFEEGPQIFYPEIAAPISTAISEFRRALATPDVRAFVVADHDTFERVVDLKGALDQIWNKEGPFPQLQLPWAYAAHDHLVLHHDGLGVVDSGSDFEYSASIIEDDFTRGPVEFFERWGAPATDLSPLSPEEKAFVLRAEPIIREIERENNRILGWTRHTLTTKADAKRGSTAAGRIVANALWEWGHNAVAGMAQSWRREAVTDSRGNRLRVVAFYNSSSYRFDGIVRRGQVLTVGTVRSMYPLLGSPQLFRARGRDVVTLHRTLRQARWIKDHTFTPQLSENLREVTLTDGSPHLQILRDDGTYGEIDPDEELILAMDYFLGRNGYRVPAWEPIFSRLRPLSTHNPMRQQDLLVRYVPRWAEVDDCAAALLSYERASSLR